MTVVHKFQACIIFWKIASIFGLVKIVWIKKLWFMSTKNLKE